MEPLWTPGKARRESANLEAFRKKAESQTGLSLKNYDQLHAWSVKEPNEFWSLLWTFLPIVAEHAKGKFPGPAILRLNDPEAQRLMKAEWFPDVRLNYAENLLQHSGPQDAIVATNESGIRRCYSFDQLRGMVFSLARHLQSIGIVPGDHVSAVLPNAPEAVVAMLAVTALGAVWSSCGPEFGPKGLIDRFSEVKPKVLFGIEGYTYKGKLVSIVEQLKAVDEALPSVEKVLMMPILEGGSTPPEDWGWTLWDINANCNGAEFPFPRFPFDHPLFIMFTSGTTGKPKCIQHRAGGMLLQHLKETVLHYDVKPGDRYFYYTSWSWNMWVWLVTPLSIGAAIILYDGSPFDPELTILFDLAEDEEITHFGVSPPYLHKARQEGLSPIKTHRLENLKTILSTGSPLSPEGFEYVYNSIKKDVCLSSISGGAELNACFAAGNPQVPVCSGELQVLALGMDVKILDKAGEEILGKPGELVCASPFPSQPIGLLNDKGDDRYYSTYFSMYPGVWRHGDWAQITPSRGMIIHGRSDTTIKISGVRIGTGEIYSALENISEIADAVAVGQSWQGDQRIILFVSLYAGTELDDTLTRKIRNVIRAGQTPRHVPSRILKVRAVPRTRTGKVCESAVHAIIHNHMVVNTEALTNPDSLMDFQNRIELKT